MTWQVFKMVSVAASSHVLLDGEKMDVVCREIRLLRKTATKILRAIQGLRLDVSLDRCRRPIPPPHRQPAAFPDREADRAAQARAAKLGSPQIARSCVATMRGAKPRDQHRARGALPTWSGQPPSPATAHELGTTLTQPIAPRLVVRRIQGRNSCWPIALLLSLTISGLRQSYLLACEALTTTSGIRLHRVRRVFKGSAAAAIRPDNWCHLRQPQCLYA
jgi:hypothetical protein